MNKASTRDSAARACARARRPARSSSVIGGGASAALDVNAAIGPGRSSTAPMGSGFSPAAHACAARTAIAPAPSAPVWMK